MKEGVLINFMGRLNAVLFSSIALLGGLVMLGWGFQVVVLTTVIPGLAPMQFNNALCFLLLGVAGLSLLLKWRTVLAVSGGLGLFLSFFTLLQYPLNTDFGIDLLLMNTDEIIKTAHPGRMAPNSALAHVLSFISLLLMTSDRILAIRWSGWLGAAVAGMGVVSLAGYAIDIHGGFSWGHYTQMALHTSIGFVAVGSALGVTVIPKRIQVENSRFNLWPYMVILLLATFFIDLQIPQGVAVGLLYVVPLVASWYFSDRSRILVVGGLCTLLIFIDILVSANVLAPEAVAFNRLMSILAVWVAAVILFFLKGIYEKQVEADLKFRLAVQGTTAGLWDWNLVDDSQWWSPQFYKLIGYTEKELPPTRENFQKLLHPDDLELAVKITERHLTKKAAFLAEYRIRHHSGKYKWFSASGQALWDEEGNPLRVVGTLIDIHARKVAEEAELKRSAELAAKNRELEELTYVVSHDLQEPVRTIAGFAGLFADTFGDELNEEGHQYLHYMQDAAERSQQLILDLLDYARIGKEKTFEEVDLGSALEDVKVDLSLKIKETDTRIEVGNMPTVHGLKTELRLLLQNLISNSIKFRKPDTAPVIRIHSVEHENEFEITVSDNGIGIDQPYLESVFVIFKRLHGKSAYEGTGIGLAHCKKVVEMHGGRIWVTSEVGEGSTFHFTLAKKSTGS